MLPPATRDEDSVEEAKADRDVLTLIMLMIDSLALTINSSVAVNTRHEKDCDTFEDNTPSSVKVVMDSVSEEDPEPLFSCSCDVMLEAVFTETDVPENTLLLSITLKQFREIFSWINDTETTTAMLQLTSKSDEIPRPLHCLCPTDFDEAMGHFFTQIKVNPKMCMTRSHLAMYGNIN